MAKDIIDELPGDSNRAVTAPNLHLPRLYAHNLADYIDDRFLSEALASNSRICYVIHLVISCSNQVFGL